MADKNNSLDKALKVLDLFVGRDSMMMSEIVAATSYSNSAVQRILNTLRENGYLYKSDSDGAYRVCIKLFFLGNQADFGRQLLTVAREPVEKLARKLGFTVSVSMLDEDGKIVTIMRNNIQTVRGLVPNIGDSRSPHASAAGKSLVAYSDNMSSIIEDADYERYTDYTITNPVDFRKEIDEVRVEGYAYDNEELMDGLFCVGKAVLNKRGNAIAALSVTGYKMKILENIDTIRSELASATDEIAKLLV